MTIFDSDRHRSEQHFYSSVDDGFAYGDLVYHYTNADVFEMFLQDDADLYLTHCRFLNDYSEFNLGLSCVWEYFKQRKFDERVIARIFTRLKECTLDGSELPWVMSFSGYNDSLYQWNSYTDVQNGGFAIGFERKKLEEICEERLRRAGRDGIMPESLYFHTCHYLGVDDVDSALNFLFDHRNVDVTDECLLETIALMFCSMVKNKRFFFENEMRLVAEYNIRNSAYDAMRIVGGKPRVALGISRFSFKVRDLIKSVIVSPYGNRRNLYNLAVVLNKKYSGNFRIVTSQAPCV